MDHDINTNAKMVKPLGQCRGDTLDTKPDDLEYEAKSTGNKEKISCTVSFF